MKNLTIGLLIVLFLAVAGLYVMYFTSDNAKTGNSSVSDTLSIDGLAYVNIDSLIFKFDMFQDRSNDLQEKQKSAEAELNSKGTQYERGIKDYQEKVTKGLVTRATAADMETSLTRQQQELITLRDQLQSNLMEEEAVMNRQVLDYITKYLEENKNKYNFQLVFGKSFGSVLLYAEPSLDITNNVLEGLNQKYQAEKE